MEVTQASTMYMLMELLLMNGIYTGVAPAAITYTIDKEQTRNINEINLVKVTTD